MRKFLLTVCSMLSITIVSAQLSEADKVKKGLETKNKDTVAWTKSGFINVGINEGFLHNWQAGGELASLTISSIFSGNATYLNHNKIWSNNLDMAYGLYYAYSTAFIPHKTDDRIDLSSKYGIRLDTAKNFYISGLFDFQTQFTQGHDYSLPRWDTSSTSKFLSPAYLTLGIGLEYRKGSDISIFLSPLAAKLTLVDKVYTLRSPEGAFGVPYGKTAHMKLGAYFSARYVGRINKDISFKTRLDLYCNYLAKDRTDSLGNIVKRDNPGNIAVLWDNLLEYKLSKYLNITFAATFIYDNDIPYSNTYVDKSGIVVQKDNPGKNLGWLQAKQIFTLGFEYKF
ncbi:MAG: DUF3078 domain-containing protein [Taibaiella sp.]|nr:DUF3078 domain-containing protein [Taibaiella sp.]